MVFTNDFAAVLPPPGPITPAAPHPLLAMKPVEGGCDVIIFHPRHDLTLARLALNDIHKVIEEWVKVYKERGTQEGIKYVQIFEVGVIVEPMSLCSCLEPTQNKGAMMGCSNPHPHGQVWSLTEVPTFPSTELASLAHFSLNPEVAPSEAPRGPKGRPCMLCEYIHFEIGVSRDKGRVVARNEHWVAVVPWWATWPFEIMCR